MGVMVPPTDTAVAGNVQCDAHAGRRGYKSARMSYRVTRFSVPDSISSTRSAGTRSHWDTALRVILTIAAISVQLYPFALNNSRGFIGLLTTGNDFTHRTRNLR